MDDQLIEAVFKREAMWNPEHKLYRNVPALRKYWMDIAKELGVKEKIVKNRWRNMRTYFVKELRSLKVKKEPGTCSCEPASGWLYFEKLRFLEKTISSIDMDIDESVPQTGEQSGDENHSVIQENDLIVQVKLEPASPESDETTHDIQDYNYTREVPETTCSTAKSANGEKMDESVKTEVEPEDKTIKKGSDMLFFESLLPFMEMVPMAKRLQLRSKIHNLILSELDTTNS